jgi:hypothetical protein
MEAKIECLKVVLTNTYFLEREYLTKKVTKELFFSLDKMKNGKYSRMDGLPCEFTKVTWDTVGEALTLTHKVFIEGKLSECLNQGLIKIIPKHSTNDIIMDGDLSLF